MRAGPRLAAAAVLLLLAIAAPAAAGAKLLLCGDVHAYGVCIHGC